MKSTEEKSAQQGKLVRKTIVYNDWVVRWFVWASIAWGVVGMLVGVIVATQLAFPAANVHELLSYGRLRPLHTNAVIFAFVGNMLFAGVYYSTQRLVKARMGTDLLSKLHFWGWQAIIVLAAVTLPLGFTQGKEYAELEWPIDILIAVVWVIFAANFFLTLYRRAERQLYVAIWFYIATIVTVAVLHIVNSLAIPVEAFKSYSIFGGAQDALVQWWYGHNAVAFFLTTPILGIMYYFVPKAADRPVYSYRLSIVHFWALVFLYIWAGPHHLLNTALPEWAQTLGMIFSLMLWAPSWGGMINGLLTLRGAWAKVRTDPVLKFFAAGVTFYGMATFEGPLLSIRSVSGLAHYTDWIVGHVHSGALGWNGFMAAGMFYFLVPRLFNTALHSKSLADTHFWLGTIGILLYMISMWVSGVTQGLMWRAENADGTLMYGTFVETLIALKPMYVTRLVGGTMYLVGMLLMVFNLAKTAAGKQPVEVSVEVVAAAPEPEATWTRLLVSQPVFISAIALLLAILFGLGDPLSSLAFLVLLVVLVGSAFVVTAIASPSGPTWHAMLEGKPLIFTALTILAVLVGGVVQIIPIVLATPSTQDGPPTRLLTPLEVAGRDIYLREGCYTCHSQMIRPMKFETTRYGDVSTLNDSRYDHPFQWGSKRTGPDLAREGVRNPNGSWHVKHFSDPRAVTDGSNMPSYLHFNDATVDFAKLEGRLRALRSVGVPYKPEDVQGAPANAAEQAQGIADTLAGEGLQLAPNSEMVAIVAYMQSLGKAADDPQKKPSLPQLAKLQVKRVDADLSVPDPNAAYWKGTKLGAVTLAAQPMVAPRPESTTTANIGVAAVHDGTRIALLLQWEDVELSEAGRLAQFSDAAAIQFPLNNQGATPPVMMGGPGQPVHIFHWRAQYQRDAEQGKPNMKDLYPNLSIDMYPLEFKDLAALSNPAEGEKFSPGVAAGNPQSYRKAAVDEIIAEGFSTSAVQEGHGSAGRGVHADGKWRLVIVRPLEVSGGSTLKPGSDSNIGFAVWQGSKGEVGSRKCVSMQWTPVHVE